jgi:hypothetical protein
VVKIKIKLYVPSKTIWVTKLRNMRWAGHVLRMEETRNAYKILVGMPEGKRQPWEDNIGTDIREYVREVWTRCTWLRIGASGGFL